MKFTYAVGCDVGKLSFHYCILKPSGQRIYESMMNNDQDSIQGFIEQIKSLLSLDSLSDCLLCMEFRRLGFLYGSFGNMPIDHNSCWGQEPHE